MIGLVNQVLAAYSRYKNPPRVIPASLFMRNERFGISNIPFDLLVENGTTISDHIQPELRKVRISGLFTNHSINGAGAFVNEDKELNGRTWKESRVEIEGAEAITNTALERWEALVKCANARQKVRVITALEVYEEMVIETLHADRGPDDGEAIKFDLTLREIRTAEFQSENAGGEWDPPEPNSQGTDAEQAMSKKANAGNVSGDGTETADEAVAKMDESLGRDYK